MTEEQFRLFTSDRGKRKAMFAEEELRQKIKDNSTEWECNEESSCERIAHVWPHLNSVASKDSGK